MGTRGGDGNATSTTEGPDNVNANANANDNVNANANATQTTIAAQSKSPPGKKTEDKTPEEIVPSCATRASKFRAAVFPVHGAEVNKFLLMGAIKFFIIMALTLTRDTKDTLVVTQCGAEAIAFLKVS